MPGAKKAKFWIKDILSPQGNNSVHYSQLAFKQLL